MFATLRRISRNRFVVVGSVVGATVGGLYALDVFNERKFKQQMVGFKNNMKFVIIHILLFLNV